VLLFVTFQPLSVRVSSTLTISVNIRINNITNESATHFAETKPNLLYFIASVTRDVSTLNRSTMLKSISAIICSAKRSLDNDSDTVVKKLGNRGIGLVERG
jgi:hypothetical protein